MDCRVVREAISAELDGEDAGVSNDLVEFHLKSCNECHEWRRSAAELHKRVRVNAAADVPNLTAPILASFGDYRSKQDQGAVQACRMILVACAFLQLFGTVPVLLDAAGASVHLDHELGSWDVALAFGFLVAAIRPERAWGMLPLVCAVAVALTFTGITDVASGHTTFSGESTHLIEVIGLAFLWPLARMHRSSRSLTPASL